MPPAHIRNLIERRVPHYLAVYLGAAFGLVQFVDFVGTRYMLSPRWTDLTLLTLALLLPSVILYIYHHGRPGRDEWQRSERILIPLNLLLLVGVLLFVGGRSHLGAVTTRVTVTDEKGNKIEAVVPNKAYRKRVAMFLFDSPPGQSVEWLRFGMPWFVYQDLYQQQFVEVVPAAYLREKLGRKGYVQGVEVPLALKRDVANEMHIPHFVTGTIEDHNGELVAKVQLYETSTAKLLKERTYRASKATDLVDQISAQLVKDLDVPTIADAKPELPVAELLTKNDQALRAYVDGVVAMQMSSDWAGGLRSIDRAIKLDPTFAAAHLARYGLALFTNQPEEAKSAIQSAMDHGYRLPERVQQLIKADYYFVRQDFARTFAVLDMLARLYPDDIAIHEMLVQINSARDDKDALIASMRKVLELDPSRAEFIQQLGDMYQGKGDATRALEYYEQYAKQFPQQAASFREIGILHRRTGDHQKARAAFEQALLVEPQDVETLLAFALLERNVGQFEEAQQKYDQALSAARTPEQKAMALTELTGFYDFTGQIEKSATTFQSALVELAKSSPPTVVLMQRLQLPGIYAKTSMSRAERELALLKQQMTKPFDIYLPLAELAVYEELENADRVEPAVVALEELIEKSSLNFLRRSAFRGRGRVNELRGNCEEAIRWYEREAKLDLFAVTPYVSMGRCYRKLGRIADAEKALKTVLKVMPANPEAHLELALLYKATGDPTRSAQHAKQAAAAWRTADADYNGARELKPLAL